MPTFAIITLKGPKGTIDLEETQSVQELYTATKNVVGWTDAEDDFYVLIVSGKKLTALDATLAVALPNVKAPKIQVIVTKLAKSAGKTSAATAAAAPAATSSTSMSDDVKEEVKEATPAPIAAAPVAPAAVAAAPTQSPVPTPSTPASPPPTSTSTSTATTTSTSTSSSTTSPIDFSNFPTDLDFLPLLYERGNIEQFMEHLEHTSPALAKSFETHPQTFLMAVETFARAAHNPQFTAEQHITSMDQALARRAPPGLGAGAAAGAAAPSAAANRASAAQAAAQQTDAMLAQLSDDEKKQVQDLVALGFPVKKAVQAFLICDKNPEYAANYLFEHMD